LILSVVWTALILLSVVCAVVTGRTAGLSAAALEGASAGVQLAIALAGPLCLWSGVGRVLDRSGVLAALARRARPVLGRLFPDSCRDEAALGSICANLSANLLGLGNAATPLGIDAVRRMQAPGDTASHEVCRFLVLNTASIQLLPTTVAALRAANGAAAPLDILPAVWVTSVCSVAVGLAAAFLFGRLWP
jgi:spore maturation protein A